MLSLRLTAQRLLRLPLAIRELLRAFAPWCRRRQLIAMQCLGGAYGKGGHPRYGTSSNPRPTNKTYRMKRRFKIFLGSQEACRYAIRSERAAEDYIVREPPNPSQRHSAKHLVSG